MSSPRGSRTPEDQAIDSSGLSLHPPPLTESARPPPSPSDPAATPTLRFPSPSPHYVSSYYYGAYDDELQDRIDANASHGSPSARFPPVSTATSSPGQGLLDSASPRVEEIGQSDTRPSRRSIVMDDVIHGVSFGEIDREQSGDEGKYGSSPLHDNRSQGVADAPSVGLSHLHTAAFGSAPFLDSPEEVATTDYFADVPSSGRPSRPFYQRSMTGASSRSSVLTGGDMLWANEQHTGANTGRTETLNGEETAALRTHGVPQGYAPEHSSGDGAEATSPSNTKKGRSVGFAPPQMAYFSSPLVQSPDLEDRAGEPAGSSADMYAMGADQTGYGHSAADQAKQGLNRIGKSIRRISRRVASGGGPEALREGGHIRLVDDADDDDDDAGEDRDDGEKRVAPDTASPQPPKASLTESLTALELPLSLRGQSLGFMGPDNLFRKKVAQLLNCWWVEPLVLISIIAHAVILIVQSSRDVFVYPRRDMYFGYWEDYAIFGIFCFYTVEMVARIVVSGLMVNPPPLFSVVSKDGEGDADQVLSPDLVVDNGASKHLGKDISPPAQGSPLANQVSGLERRRLSKSNTLDAFSEFGDSIKSRAQAALRMGEEAGGSYRDRPTPARRSTAMSSRMSLFDLDARPSAARAHHRNDTVATTATDKAAAARPHPGTIVEEDFEPELPALASKSSETPRPAAMRQDSSHILQTMHRKAVPFVQAMIVQRSYAPHYAYLRHSWNRVDFFSIIAFWIAFALAATGHEATSSYHLYIFRAISVLRIARLLAITSGTTTILHSLKLAAPLLFNVLVFTTFAMILFSIIGIQSFKGSYRRSCVWDGDLTTGINSEPGSQYTLSQICGGWYDQNGGRNSYIATSGLSAPGHGKGFFCPAGQQCVEQDSNPYSNTQSFDNILTSLLQVIVVISNNGWSSTMYDMVDADYFVAVFYFIIGIIFLNFWLANLFVAVITNSFATMSAQTNQSAFAAKDLGQVASILKDESQSKSRRRRKKVASVYKRVWGYTKYLWLAAIIANIASQASRTSYQTSAASRFVRNAELWFTVAFDIEIVLRFLAYLLDDDWRSFYGGGGTQSTRNIMDTMLCVITSIMEIPVVRDSRVYAWLTIFQLQRFYRVIVAIPRIEALLLRAFGSLSGLLNMIAFLLFMVGLAAIVAVQLFRGDIPAENDDGTIEMNFKHIYNSFLAMYEIFSSENWNTVLFDVLQYEFEYRQAAITAMFICGWFLFSNFIVLQMFIAVINEGFSITEAEMRRQQLDRYVRRLEPGTVSVTGRFLHKLSPYRWLKDHNASVMGQPREHRGVHAAHNEGLRQALDDFDEKNKRRMSLHRFLNPSKVQRLTRLARRVVRLDHPDQNPVPLDTVQQQQVRQSFSGAEVLRGLGPRRQQSMAMLDEAGDEDEAARLFARERQLVRIRTDLGLATEKLTQGEIDAAYVAKQEVNPRIAMARAINAHPSFDKSLWLFTNHSKFRRFCQSLVPSSYGERIFGRQHHRNRYRILRIVMFITITASVVVVGVASPLYRKSWYAEHGLRRDSWFTLIELGLSSVFFLEFFIKIVADGFAFTPNAYLLSPWHILDLLVLASLVVNVSSEIIVIGGVSRFTRALKAFRALRLINLSTRMRSTFENLVGGGGHFLDASALAILYIIPFAVWGQNLFSGSLYACNDTITGITIKSQCVGEFSAQPSEWTFMAPRVWDNPQVASSYSFDNFKSALLILFEIVSLEGWINVMQTAMSITGSNQQPVVDANQVNSIYFVIYNLMGAVFVLTLFVSVIIEGFQSATGAAFFSTEQRQWIDLKRLMSRQKPAKRPAVRPPGPLRGWCFDRATRKHDWWGRFMTGIYLANVITLCTQTNDQGPTAERIRDYIYLVFASIYGLDVVIRLFGIGWNAFRRSLWCVYDLFVVVGIIANTLPLVVLSTPTQVNVQLQKFFLTAATLKLVAKHNGLNQLFKTAQAGLPAILNLLGLWLCFFLFFGLMFVEVFGLTKWGYIGPESYSRNFSSLPLALIFLSMMSVGEGWNGYMHDYTVEDPLCTPSANYLDSDCGSQAWAYPLFIGWNLFSMYIFLNMFTATVIENFAYVFQLGGKPVLGREDMRGFKRTWMAVAGTSSTLPRDKIIAFLRALPGKFEMRIYPQELSISALREAALYSDAASIHTASDEGRRRRDVMARLRGSSSSPTKSQAAAADDAFPAFAATGHTMRTVDGINVTRLHDIVFALDGQELRQRRERFNRVWHEACIIADESEESKDISFQDMLKLVALHKLVDPSTALSVEELVARERLDEKIDDRINLERVRSVMKTAYLRHRFNLLRREKHIIDAEISSAVGHDEDSDLSLSPAEDGVPIIRVDDTQSPPRSSTRGGNSKKKLDLRLDVAALSALDPADRGLRTPPTQTGAWSSALPDTRSRLSPSASSLRSGASSPRSRLGHVDVEELERRASPLLESFDDTPWGRMMNRMSKGVNRVVVGDARMTRRSSAMRLNDPDLSPVAGPARSTEDITEVRAGTAGYYPFESSEALIEQSDEQEPYGGEAGIGAADYYEQGADGYEEEAAESEWRREDERRQTALDEEEEEDDSNWGRAYTR